MNDPKRNHVVAEMHQSRFQNDEGGLYFFDFEQPELGVRSTRKSALFVRKNYYTTINSSGHNDFGFEKFLAKDIEGPANRIFEKIVNNVRTGKFPTLSGSELMSLRTYIYFQIKRVPETIDRITTSDEIEDDLRTRMEKDGYLDYPSLKEEGKALSRPVPDWMIKSVRVGAQGLNDGRVVNAMSKFGMRFSRVRQKNKALILGSNPVLINLGRSVDGTQKQSGPIWMPISSDVAVAPWGEAGKEYLVDFGTQAEIRSINVSIATQSRIIAAGSRSLLESLASRR